MDTDCHAAAIAAADPEGFGRWVAAVETRLRAGLKRFARHVDTEAIVQETLLRIWNVAPRFVPDGRPDGLLRLALRIAHNLAVSEARRQRLPIASDDELREAADPARALVVPDVDLRATIAWCRRKLPARPAAALSARLESAGAETDRTLAARLGMRLNTFLQNITRARRLLARCLHRHGIDLELEMS